MTYKAPFGFSNPHINTILANNGPRKWLVGRHARTMEEASSEVVLDCRKGVKLHGVYTANNNANRGLVILIHGWEGSSQSTYLQSAASHLFEAGFSVFRLHMRDHGPSHHLNFEPFRADRLEEILDGLEEVSGRFSPQRTILIGFSLGGNLAVRAAAHVDQRPIVLDKVIAVSPAIAPERVGQAIQDSPIYRRYFLRKWRRSFTKKIEHFPAHAAHAHLLDHHDMMAMHEEFIPLYSHYPDASSYFAAYALNKANLRKMDVPCHIILAEDDPVIPIDSAGLLPNFPELTVETLPHGGHCGFIENYRFDSWIDHRLVALCKSDL